MAGFIDSWERLCQLVEARWPVLERSGARLTLGGNGKRAFLERMEVAAFPERALVELRIPLAPDLVLTPEGALRISDELGIGTISLREGRYQIRHVVDLRAIDIDALDRMLGFVARLADVVNDAKRLELSGCGFEIYCD